MEARSRVPYCINNRVIYQEHGIFPVIWWPFIVCKHFLCQPGQSAEVANNMPHFTILDSPLTCRSRRPQPITMFFHLQWINPHPITTFFDSGTPIYSIAPSATRFVVIEVAIPCVIRVTFTFYTSITYITYYKYSSIFHIN